MINVRLYSPENVDRAKYAQIGMLVLAAAVCGFFAFSAVSSANEIWSAQKALSKEKKDLVNLTRQESKLHQEEAGLPPPSHGGVEEFAVMFANWAQEGNLYIESVVPEGTPTDSEIAVDDIQLGTWTASKVRVRGKGQFTELVALFDRFRKPGMPVSLDSFTLQTADENTVSYVAFELVLTVYEKKSGES